MTPLKWDLWTHARRVTELCPALFPSVYEAYARLQEARWTLSRSGVNLWTPCGRGSSRDACELPRQMQQWNRLLAPINTQLREGNTPGELAILSVDGCQGPSKYSVQRAVVLVHWLLLRHPCVAALRADYANLIDFSLLYGSVHLSSLKCSGEYLYGQDSHSLLSAMLHLRHLEEFACDSLDISNESGNMPLLCDIITRNTNLYRLEVQKFVYRFTSLSYLLRVLAMNVRLRELCLDVSCLQESERRLFPLALKENRALKSLRLVGSLWNPSLSVAALAEALEGATALTSLELCYFRVTTDEAWALATSLICNQSVQQLALFACVPIFSHLTSVPGSGDKGEASWSGASKHIDPFVYMLHKLTSLRKLTFPVSSYPLEDQRAFLEALVGKDSIEEVRVQSLNHRHLIEFRSLVSETGIGGRVKFCSVPVEERRLDRDSCEAYGRDVHEWLDIELPNEVYGRFKHLSTFHGLTSMDVCLGGAIDAESAGLFGQYLRNTKTLKDLSMSFSACSDEALVLLDALSLNTSITSLDVEGLCRTRRTARLLADVVSSSKNIQAFAYYSEGRNASRAFFLAFAQHIASNFTILSVKMLPRKREGKHWNRIQEVVTRNHTLLIHAARYVTGCVMQKSGAEALELMSSNPMLVSKVEEMASLSENAAMGLIRSRLADLDDIDFFMTIAGVVKESVVCEETAKGRACLGALPYDCWLSLRRFLRVADVIDWPQRI
ncbi:hypothetical protein V5799_009182 [Amblyomma americanum]|uniref:Nlr family card domain protein n=1 Tax=Amblyomma americanum TaxID=6943 RepID=A0AAQ4FCT2_AMBAM